MKTILFDLSHFPILFAVLFSVIAWIDWRKRVIWHALTVPTMGIALIGSSELPAARWEIGLFGLCVCGGLMGVIWGVVNGWYGIGRFGFGDVTLSALIGSVFGVVAGLWVIAVGILLAGGFALLQLLSGAERDHRIAYGSFLALSAAIGLLV